ncbi:MAG: RNA-binding protein [Pedobacter sp.]|nr:MAG: RNA-binding protein [Pedobacter sp.]
MFKLLKSPLYIGAICIIALASCNNKVKEGSPNEDALFSLLPSEETHVDFNNTIVESRVANIISYQYFYNGGGVATGDLNNDGLDDIYLAGNMTKAKLYLNKGNMQFEDITSKAGIEEIDLSWKTGVTFADVNGDGKLDIYQCYSGGLPAKNRQNTLLINQGNDASGMPLFKEEAAKYGLNDDSYSTQAVFFDYDGDSNLDMFLLNHNPKVFTTLEEVAAPAILKEPAPMMRVKLYKNVNGRFEDFSDRAGLYNSSFTYGLGAGIADVNNDGKPDIYISNDYSAPDYLYINNGDGTFTDQIKQQVGHMSMYSMGNDIADINNDGLSDILTLDMLPEDNQRQKLLFAPDNYEYNDLRLKLGFHHQDMRNMLHINNGNGTFSEIGQLSGISNTDWSWAPLFADYDNDGWKDLFVSNGYLKDYTNMDFLKFKGDFLRGTDPAIVKESLLELVSNMPASNVNNYIYRNNGDLTFSNKGAQWGMTLPSNSNGAAYADLDNDGDLDLVINNINLPAFIYQNNSAEVTKHNYLKLKLAGSGHNTQGIGAKVWLYAKNKLQYLEQNPSRGYQSSVSPILHFGLGKMDIIDSVRIVWQGGNQQVLKNVKPNQLLALEEKNATNTFHTAATTAALFNEIKSPVSFNHQKNNINDFKRQPLLINPISLNGPCMAKADVNGDGLEDLFVGGARNQAGAIFIQNKNGTFINKPVPHLDADKQSDDIAAIFFDANSDGFPDLYVASGGYSTYTTEDPLLQDRLYINNGKGGFTKSTGIPKMYSSKSCVAAADFNSDGHQDLFIGGRVVPGRYPEAPQSYLLINDGKGNFSDQLANIAPAFQKAGMITDAGWADLNGDKKPDLIVVGDWMPITVLINENGKLVDKTNNYFDKSYAGWWNKLLIEDLNGDGKPDLIIGNNGLNSQCKASDAEPAEMYYKDFDDNGSVDPILCMYIQGKTYPHVTRDELFDQMSMMRNRYADYKSYANQTMTEIFTADELKDAKMLKANYLKTAVFINNGKGKFKETPLPIEVQNSPIYAITIINDKQNGHKDLLLCGNVSRARLKFGNNDANYGILLKNDGKGRFSYVPQLQSGFKIKGDVKSIISFHDKLLFGINQQEIKAYQLNSKQLL